MAEDRIFPATRELIEALGLEGFPITPHEEGVCGPENTDAIYLEYAPASQNSAGEVLEVGMWEDGMVAASLSTAHEFGGWPQWWSSHKPLAEIIAELRDVLSRRGLPSEEDRRIFTAKIIEKEIQL